MNKIKKKTTKMKVNPEDSKKFFWVLLVFVLIIGIWIGVQGANQGMLTLATSAQGLTNQDGAIKVRIRALDASKVNESLYTIDQTAVVKDGQLKLRWQIPGTAKKKAAYIEVCALDKRAGPSAAVKKACIEEVGDVGYNKVSCPYYVPANSTGFSGQLNGWNKLDDSQKVGCSGGRSFSKVSSVKALATAQSPGIEIDGGGVLVAKNGKIETKDVEQFVKDALSGSSYTTVQVTTNVPVPGPQGQAGANGANGVDGAAGIATVSGGGLILTGTNLSLDDSCAAGELLKWDGSNWGCAVDDGGTDSQTLSLFANLLSISGGNSVNLSGYLDNTDSQALSWVSGTRTLSLTGGGSVVISDSDTTYSAGNGLSLGGTTFSINSPTCAGTTKLTWNGTAFSCSADVDTDTDTTNFNVAAQGTGGSQNIASGDTVTFNNGTGTTATRSSGTVTYSLNNTAVSAGTYSPSDNANGSLALPQLTVDAQGRLTAASTTNVTLTGIANSQLANSAITVNTSGGLSGGASVSLGGSLNLTLDLSDAADANTATLSSGSGLEVSGGEIGLLRGCSTGELLKYNSTSGVWACAADTDTDTGVTSIGTIDSQTKSANGAVISGTVLYLQTADASNVGLVSTGTQTFAGDKTFSGNIIASGNLNANGDTTLGDAATDGLTFTGEIRGASPLAFEGVTNDGVYITFAITDPTLARTVTFPDRSGTVSLSGDTFTGDVTGTLNSSGATTLTIAANSVVLGTDTTGDYVSNVTAGGGLTGTATGEASTPTLAIVSSNGGIVVNADDIALTIASSADALSAITSSGSGLEILASGLTLVQGCSDTQVLAWNETTDVWACSTPTTAVTTIGTIDSQAKSANGAVISGNTLYLQTADATNVGLVSTGTQTFAGDKTFSGNIIASGNLNANGDVTLGDAATDGLTFTGEIRGGSPLSFEGSTNDGIYTIFAITDPTISDKTITFPDATGMVLVHSQISGDATVTSGGVLTIGTGAVTSGKIFDGTITTTDISGSAGITNAQLANSSVTVTSGNGLITGGLVSLGGSITLDVGAGDGVTVNANDITLDLTAATDGLSSTTSSSSGLEVLTSGLTLLQGCGDGQVLTWNETTDVWACATPTVAVTTIGTIDSQTKSANGAVISGNTLYMQNADASFPGLVSTGTQTFAGNKTFNGTLTVNNSALFQNASNSTGALVVNNAAGEKLFGIDTITTNNLLSNGSFESNTTGWAAKGSASISQITSQNYLGSGSMQITTTAAAGDGAKYDYALASQKTYSITLYAKSNVTSAAVSTISIGRTEDGSTETDCATSQTANGSGWSRITCVFHTGATSGTNYIYIKQSDATARVLYLDSVELQDTTNLVTNSDFETDVSGWTSYSGAALSQDVVEFNTGAASMKVDTSGSGANEGAAYYPSGGFQPNTTYTASAWVKLDSGSASPTSVSLVRNANTSDPISGTTCQSQSLTAGTWTKYTCSFTTASTTLSNGYITLYQASNLSTPVTFYVDTVGLAVTKYNTNDIGRITLNGSINSPLTIAGPNSTNALLVQGSDQSGTPTFVVDTTNSFVGIGTAAPTKTLHVEGKALVKATSSDTDTFRVESSAASNHVAFNVGASTKAVSVGASTNTSNGSLSVFGTQTNRTLSNSATAFRVLDAASAPVLTVSTSTSNKLVYIGSGGNDGKLQVVDSSGNALFDADTSGGGYLGLTFDTIVATGSIAQINGIYADGVTGSVSINTFSTPAYTLDVGGDVNVSTGSVFRINGVAGATTTCSGGQFLQNQVSLGGLTMSGTCATPTDTGATSIGTIDSQTKSANGAVISGTGLYMQTADATYPGLVSTGTQTFAGDKTFSGTVTGNTSIMAPLFDQSTAAALDIGTTNATAINLNQNTAIASNKTLTANGRVVFKDASNSPNAFQIQNSGGDALFNAGSSVLYNAAADNMITNSNFENGALWQNKNGGSVSGAGTSGAYLGQWWMSNNNTGVDDGSYYNVTLSPSTNYTFSAYVRLPSGSMSTLVLGRQDQSGTDNDCAASPSFADTDGWVRVSCTFTTGGTISSSNVYIKQSDAVSRGIYVDAVMLQQTGSLNAYTMGDLFFSAPINKNLLITGGYSGGKAFQVQTSTGDALFAIDTASNQITAAVGMNFYTPSYIFKNTADSAYAFQVQNSVGANAFNVNTSNNRIEFDNYLTSSGLAQSSVADGASAKGFTFSTTNNFTTSGAKLLSVANWGVEKVYIDKDGGIDTVGGVTTDGDNILGDSSSDITTSNGSIVAANAATGTTDTTSGTGTNTTTVTISGTSFSDNDVILIDNAGQDYFTRVVSGGGTSTLTVSPAVSFDNGVTATKYNIQNIGATSVDYSTLDDRFFQGYFLGGVVTGAGSTTLSDGRLASTTGLNFNSPTYAFTNTSDSTSALKINKANGESLIKFDTATNENLLTNGGFESSTTGWAAKGSATLSQVTSQKYLGTGSMEVTTTATADDGAKFDYSLASQSTYTLTFYVKSSNPSTAVSTLSIGRTEDGSTDSNCATSQTATSSGWSKVTCTFTTGNVTGTNNIYIKQSDAIVRTLYIDSVQLQTYSGLNANTDFETDSTGWSSYNAPQSITQSTAQAYTGTGSLQVVLSSTSGSSEGAVITDTVQPNTTYNASFMVRLDGATAASKSFSIIKRLDTIDNGLGTNCVTQTITADTWTNISCTFTTGPVTAASPFIGVVTTDSGDFVTQHTFYIDNAVIAPTKTNSNDVGRVTLNAAIDSPLTVHGADSSSAFQVQQQNGKNVLTVDTVNGYVGIGTATPTQALDVSGRVFIKPIVGDTNTSTFAIQNSAGTQAFLVNAVSRIATVGINSGTSNATLNNYGVTTLKTLTNSASALQVQNSSAVNIFGVDTSNSRLTTGIANGASATGFTFNTTNAYTTAGAKLLSLKNATVEKLSVDKDGGLTTSGSNTLGDGGGALQTWATTSSLGTARRIPGATSGGNGHLYVVGGYGGGYLATVEYTKVKSNGTLGTWSSTTSLGTARQAASVVSAHGYVYAIGGTNGSSLSSVEYAKINADGTLGTWATTTSLNTARERAGAVVVNGYIYIVGGSAVGDLSSVEYAKINADGTLGTWATTTSLGTARNSHGVTAANGYIYAVAGNSGAPLSSVEYAQVTSNGTLSAWNTTSTMNTARHSTTATAANGYIYTLGGDSGAGDLGSVEYAPISSTGTVGTWVTDTNSITTARNDLVSVTMNGYIYALGGYAGGFSSVVDYASTPRTKIAGALDLINFGGEDIAGGNSGSSLSAGNTLIVGTLDVQDRANFLEGVTFEGKIAAHDDIAIRPTTDSTTAFQIQNSAGTTTLLTADTTKNTIGLGGDSGTLIPWATTTGPGVDRSESGYVAAGGYVYATGGAGGSATVYYTKINADGSLGTWQTTTSMNVSRDQHVTVAANGYIYAIGGSGPITTVEYAKINADGTLGAWQSASSMNSARYRFAATVANGYIYVVGDPSTPTTEYAKIKPDGSLGTWQVGASLSTARYGIATVTANGYIYAIGGSTGADSAVVEYASLNKTTGAIGTWASGTSMNNARNITRAVVANGHIYTAGGFNVDTTEHTSINNDGTLDTWQAGPTMTDTRWGHGLVTANGYIYAISGDGTTTAEYTSVPRTKVGGALDLVGYDGGTLSDPGIGGSLTAGNTMIIGTLDVHDRANFLQGVAIGNTLTIGGDINQTASTTTGTAAGIVVNSLTTGSGLAISSTNTATTGNLLSVSSGSTSAFTNGGVRFNFTGAHTGNGVQIDDVTSTGNAFQLTTTSLTSGNGLVVSGTGVNLTGNLLSATSASTAAFTNGGVRFNFTGAHTGNGVQIDDVTTTGNVYQMNANSLTSGNGLVIANTGANLTGNLFSVTSGSTSAFTNGGIRYNFTGAHTGNGVQIDDATTTGTIYQINASALTTGTAFQVTGPSSKNLIRIMYEANDPLDKQRVIIGGGGIAASKPDSLARDQLYVFGRINYSWNMFTQDFLTAAPSVAADGAFMDGYYDENIGTGGTAPSGSIAMQNTTGASGMARLTFTGTLGTGPWASNWGTGGNLVTERSLNPVLEARVQASSNTDVRHIVGFTDMALNATTSADTNNSANEVFFRKTAAGTNWEAVTRNGSGTENVTTLATACAGSSACTTTALRTMRIELENVGANGTARFYIDGTLVATHTTTAVPANTNRLGWLLTNTPTTTTYTGRTLDMDYVRVWSDDPPSSIAPGDVGQNDGVEGNTNTTENDDTPTPEDNSNEALLGRIKALEEDVSELNQYEDVLTTEAIGESSLKKAIFIADVEFRKQVEFSADALFKANVNVDGTLNANGRVVVSNNTGTITIQPGQTEIQVLFTKPLVGKPNVFLSTENPDVKVVAQTRTKDGFVIKLSEPISDSLDVQWFAVEKE